MSSKLVLGFLGGLLAATALTTALSYLQLHRNTTAAAKTAETEVIVTPPAPFPETPVPAAQPAPVKAVKTKVAPAKPVALKQAKVQRAKVEAPSVREPPSVAVPARVAVLAAPLPPPRVQVDITPMSAPEPSQPRSVTIASNTLVTVRLGETVSTERNQPGDKFVATLDQPLVVDGLVIAGEGARATGRVVDSVEAGRINGLALLSLELTNLMTSDGQNISLRTARFSKFGIGAASGGAAGGGVAVASRGRPSMLPAATKISFCVDQPVTITEKR